MPSGAGCGAGNILSLYSLAASRDQDHKIYVPGPHREAAAAVNGRPWTEVGEKSGVFLNASRHAQVPLC